MIYVNVNALYPINEISLLRKMWVLNEIQTLI